MAETSRSEWLNRGSDLYSSGLGFESQLGPGIFYISLSEWSYIMLRHPLKNHLVTGYLYVTNLQSKVTHILCLYHNLQNTPMAVKFHNGG